jgi:hypothetical protein
MLIFLNFYEKQIDNIMNNCYFISTDNNLMGRTPMSITSFFKGRPGLSYIFGAATGGLAGTSVAEFITNALIAGADNTVPVIAIGAAAAATSGHIALMESIRHKL